MGRNRRKQREKKENYNDAWWEIFNWDVPDPALVEQLSSLREDGECNDLSVAAVEEDREPNHET